MSPASCLTRPSAVTNWLQEAGPDVASSFTCGRGKERGRANAFEDPSMQPGQPCLKPPPTLVEVRFWTAFFSVPPPVPPPFPNPFVCVNKWRANKRDNPVHILSYFSCALVNVRQVWMGQKPIKKIFTECHASSLEVWLLREVLTHWVLQKKQPTYRQHLSILKRGKSIQATERSRLRKCRWVLIYAQTQTYLFGNTSLSLFFLGKNLWCLAVKQLEKFISHYWSWHLIT